MEKDLHHCSAYRTTGFKRSDDVTSFIFQRQTGDILAICFEIYQKVCKESEHGTKYQEQQTTVYLTWSIMIHENQVCLCTTAIFVITSVISARSVTVGVSAIFLQQDKKTLVIIFKS